MTQEETVDFPLSGNFSSTVSLFSLASNLQLLSAFRISFAKLSVPIPASFRSTFMLVSVRSIAVDLPTGMPLLGTLIVEEN